MFMPFIWQKKTRCLETLYARVSFEDGFLEEAQEKILRTISQVLEHYYALFGDTAEQEPLLASFFKSRHESSWGGTYLSNSFIAEINPVVDHDAQLLIAHEIFHKWNGQKIKKHDGDKNEAKTYWWSEGFTDYYSVLCAYRAGIIPLDKFASKINQFLDDNFTSPVKNFPNERIEALFWEDQNIHHLPYHRGFLFALYLDGKIKTQTQHRFSLDDVMRDMFSHTQMHRCSFSDDLFKDLVQRYVPEGIERALDLYVLQGHSIPLEELTELPLEKTYTTNLWEGSWIHQESTSPGKFKVVVGKVLENSPAWRAGLREGEIITYDPAQNTPAQFFCKKTLETNEVVDISVPSNVRVRLLPKTPEENEGVRTYFRGPSFSSEFGDDLS